MTRAQALALVDALYAEKRRDTWTRLLTADGDCDVEGMTELFAEFDREFERERERLVAWLESLPEGGYAQRPAHV